MADFWREGKEGFSGFAVVWGGAWAAGDFWGFGGGISVLRRLSLGFAAVWRGVVFLCVIVAAFAAFFGWESGKASGWRFAVVGGIGYGKFLRRRVVG